MVKEYFEAANKLSSLAEEFSENDEVANILRAGSAKIAKMAASCGGIIKTASTEDPGQEQTD